MAGYVVPALLALPVALLFIPVLYALALPILVVVVSGVVMVALKDRSERNAPD